MRSFRLSKRRLFAAAAMVAVSLLPAACGFHLAGSARYPPSMAVTYIDAGDRYTPFYRKLKDSLRQGGVRVTAVPTEASAVLRIHQDQSGERVLSVTARNTPVEFDVYYIVRYSLEIGGSEALPSQQLALNRDYTYDETLVLGKAAESDVIRQALADDLVGLVNRRLTSLE
jgi:LPS-assembly lipoprotein